MNVKDKKKALENKLREIEKKKKTSPIDTVKPVQQKNELVNLKEELKQLKEKKKERAKKAFNTKSSKNTKQVVLNEVEKDEVEKKSSPQKKTANQKEDFKQAVQEKINKNISSKNTTNDLLKTTNSYSTNAQIIKDVASIDKKDLRKKIVVKRNSNNHTAKVIIYLSIAFAIAILVYLVKLRMDLKKEQDIIQLQEKEKIDYSKNDAFFKEVEEDEEPMELQKIK